jgi:ATP-dependent Clp protease ATP-binding subunit ClpB
MFKPLTHENLTGIIDILVSSLRKRLADKTLGLEVHRRGQESHHRKRIRSIYGARPLKRYLQSSAETLIAKRDTPRRYPCRQHHSCWSTLKNGVSADL